MDNDNRKIVSLSFFLGGFLISEWLRNRGQRSSLGKRLLPGIVVGGICWIAYPYLAK